MREVARTECPHFVFPPISKHQNKYDSGKIARGLVLTCVNVPSFVRSAFECVYKLSKDKVYNYHISIFSSLSCDIVLSFAAILKDKNKISNNFIFFLWNVGYRVRAFVGISGECVDIVDWTPCYRRYALYFHFLLFCFAFYYFVLPSII